ncbi:ParA family protein [Pseudomonas edaphica]|uniref:ParA family protein n=1 Tax=Pseudomonas edaphica TaxID=2006980 RepID=A0ABY2U0W5_9PSED|nr:ParA family protein [Pseudomonas edaphica]TLG89521.1 ParA family protein [Pseudomonas edaphica]
MRVWAIGGTKGGVGKTTVAANLGGIAADAGLRVLLLDLDIQPTLSSYFKLEWRAPCGTYELLAFNESRLDELICHTRIRHLDLVLSNDDQNQLNTLLLHAPDGRLRLRNLLSVFSPYYDLMLIDTQGARSVLLEMAILASDAVLSPVMPEILAARELQRGTLKLMSDLAPYQYLGIPRPPLHILINRVHPVSANARLIQQTLRQVFFGQRDIRVLNTVIPALEAYPRAAMQWQAVHRVETRCPAGRLAPAALDTMRSLACELFPQWRYRFEGVSGKKYGRFGHADV